MNDGNVFHGAREEQTDGTLREFAIGAKVRRKGTTGPVMTVQLATRQPGERTLTRVPCTYEDAHGTHSASFAVGDLELAPDDDET